MSKIENKLIQTSLMEYVLVTHLKLNRAQYKHRIHACKNYYFVFIAVQVTSAFSVLLLNVTKSVLLLHIECLHMEICDMELCLSAHQATLRKW